MVDGDEEQVVLVQQSSESARYPSSRTCLGGSRRIPPVHDSDVRPRNHHVLRTLAISSKTAVSSIFAILYHVLEVWFPLSGTPVGLPMMLNVGNTRHPVRRPTVAELRAFFRIQPFSVQRTFTVRLWSRK